MNGVMFSFYQLKCCYKVKKQMFHQDAGADFCLSTLQLRKFSKLQSRSNLKGTWMKSLGDYVNGKLAVSFTIFLTTRWVVNAWERIFESKDI